MKEECLFYISNGVLETLRLANWNFVKIVYMGRHVESNFQEVSIELMPFWIIYTLTRGVLLESYLMVAVGITCL